MLNVRCVACGKPFFTQTNCQGQKTCFPMFDTSINAFFSVFIFVESWSKVFQVLRIVVECRPCTILFVVFTQTHVAWHADFFQFCFVAPCKKCKNFQKNKFQTVESCLFPPRTEWFQTFDSFSTFAFTVLMLPLRKGRVMPLPRFVHVNRVRWSDLAGKPCNALIQVSIHRM